jgi:hypothetical protein
VSTIEENVQMEEQPMHSGDPDDYGSQYTGYDREVDTYSQDCYTEGDYFNPGDDYSAQQVGYEGDDGYGE